MKKLLRFIIAALFVIPVISSCRKYNPDEEIPSYISIPYFTFNADSANQGTSLHDFSDAWVFRGNEFLGVFPIGTKIPVLAEGDTEIKIRPGIKQCGIGDLRSIYGPCQFYIATVNLKRGEVATIVPQFTYFSGVTFSKLESFSSPGTFLTQSPSSDTFLVMYNGPEALPGQGNCAHVYLDNTYLVFDARSGSPHVYTQGSSVFLELHYKTEAELIFSVSDGNIDLRKACSVLPSAEWKKMYVNLTEAISGPFTLTNYYLVLHATLPAGKSSANIYFDNIKLIRQ